MVYLEKGGDIIPKVTGVDLEAREAEGGRQPLTAPKECPSCKAPVTQLEGEVDLYCTNPHCAAQRAERIRHFVSRRAMDIESMGPALIDQLLEGGLVATYADLYKLESAQLSGLERMAEKSARNVIEAIAASRSRPLDKFIHGLGIRHVGERAARVLAGHFKSLPELREASEEALEDVNEIGAVTANSVHTYLADATNWGLIEQALASGLRPVPLETGAAAAPALEGRTVVITGTLSEPRGRWKARLESAGASVTGSVSKKTDFVLAGANPGSKLEAAMRHEVRVVDEAEMTILLEAQ
jgi:DNA ligase (NAD+)